MLEVLEDPVIRARVPAMTVQEYHRLFDLGAIKANVELIRGALVEKMPKSPLHSSIVEVLREHLKVQLSERYFVRQEQPITLADSEPEPDLAVIEGDRQQYFGAHPTTAALIVEVVVSSEHLDRVKLALYAEAGVRECWLLLAEERAIERHTEPKGAGYQRVERAVLPGALESTVIPGLTMPSAGLFPS